MSSQNPFEFFPEKKPKKLSKKKKASHSAVSLSSASRSRSGFSLKKKKTRSGTRSALLLAESISKKELKKPKNLADGFFEETDNAKRAFLKVAGVAGAGLIASQLLPKKAEALIMGSTPSSSVVGLKDASNTRINPATDEGLDTLLVGNGVTKLTISLAASGNVRTPASGKKIRVYATRFSLTADATSVSFRFTSGGTDYEKYVSPKTGGLYGSNNHPNYVEGGINEVLYCNISGTTTVQINIDYLEV